jgi:rubrerythrin
MQILDRCAQLDDKATALYETFAGDAPTPEAKEFWTRMAHEEKDHVELWAKMHKLAELGILPEVFDNPDQILAELDHILTDSSRCRERYLSEPNTRSAILCA